jgi:aryl-alcohol dehydrogenase-like predicted oxidoreductase
MERVALGRTGINVSRLCLGTMTWGSQNTEIEGHAQGDMALDRGVTFWDTAEMYPTNPVRAETIGDTEIIIGTWLAARGGRDRLEIATKVTGTGNRMARADGGPITGAVLRAGVEASLRRMQTDYIDLFQLHWPNRGSYAFRQGWTFAPRVTDRAVIEADMLDILQTAAALMAEGKIRAIGLSNESVWGAALWLHLAQAHDLPRMAAVQNEYSLLSRQFDTDWCELSAIEDMPLLAFSPLAAGLLSGKYAGDVTPEGTRRSFTPDLGGRITQQVFPAVAAYLGIAADHGLDPCQMAVAFCMTRPFPCIPIIGASDLGQLATNIGAVDVVLSEAVLQDIAAAHRSFPAPF